MNSIQETPWDNPRFRNWVSVARACHAVSRAMGQELAPLDLKPAHLDLMMNIHRHPGYSQQEIAKKLLVGRSNITMLLPQLEKRGFVRREADEIDRRVLRLYMTDEGELILSKALSIYLSLIDRLTKKTSDEDCDALGRAMHNIIMGLEAD